MGKNFCFFLLISLFILSISSQNTPYPGIKLTVSTELLTRFTNTVIPKLQDFINNVYIPGSSGSVGIPIVGTISWTLGETTLSNFDLSTTSITSVPGVGLLLSIPNASGTITISYDWEFRSIIFQNRRGSGTVTIDDSGANINIEVEIGENNNRATAVLVQNSVDLNHLNIVIETKNLPDWLLNLLENIFNNAIKQTIETNVQDAIAQQIASLNDVLQSEPIEIPLGTTELGVNIGLPQAPNFTTSYIAIGINGGFYQVNDPTDVSPYQANFTPDQVDATATLNVIVDQYVFNTAGYAMWHADLLNFVVPSNTSVWRVAIPNLYQAYPDYPMDLDINCTSAPNANLTTSGVSFTSLFALDYVILFENGTRSSVLTLALQIQSDLNLYLNYTDSGSLALYGEMSKLSIQTSVISSSIGRVNVVIINTALLTLTNAIIIPQFNAVFGAGIPLPLTGTGTVTNQQVIYGNGYVGVTATF